MQFNLDNARVIPISECKFPVVHTGRSFGSVEDDSVGRAVVLGYENNYYAAYATETGNYIIEETISYATILQANTAAEDFTRHACTNDLSE